MSILRRIRTILCRHDWLSAYTGKRNDGSVLDYKCRKCGMKRRVEP